MALLCPHGVFQVFLAIPARENIVYRGEGPAALLFLADEFPLRENGFSVKEVAAQEALRAASRKSNGRHRLSLRAMLQFCNVFP